MQTPILIAIAAIFLSGFRIAQEYQRAIVFRLGHFKTVKGPGLYWLIPLIETQNNKKPLPKTASPSRSTPYCGT